MNVAGKTIVVVGLGASGISAARLLVSKGAQVIANDAAPRERLSADVLALEPLGVRIEAGGHSSPIFENIDAIVISPGVPAFAALKEAEQRGIPVIGEMELASQFVNAPIALIGGTNGKSTVTALSAAMLEASGLRVFIGGNFGTPLSEAAGKEWDALVLEISSFQAERVPTLHARVHALLNITDDHLDRYDTFGDYANAKGNPFVVMTSDDYAVIPAGNPVVLKQAQRGAAKQVTFSVSDPNADIAVIGDRIVDRRSGAEYSLTSLRISGLHNLENACASIGVATALGATPEAIQQALNTFEGLGHRTVFVADIEGVHFYDDSKGTNVGASVAALLGLRQEKAVLIAGGRDKLGDYTPLVDALKKKGRALVLIGEAAARIEKAAKDQQIGLPIAFAASMEEAVLLAKKFAHPGDAVLLSPACSSFDMFRDYKHRGDVFVRAVREMEKPFGAFRASDEEKHEH